MISLGEGITAEGSQLGITAGDHSWDTHHRTTAGTPTTAARHSRDTHYGTQPRDTDTHYGTQPKPTAGTPTTAQPGHPPPQPSA